VKAWQRAINTLPKENLTPTELKQKEQYEDGLKAALLAKRKAKDEPLQTIHVPKGSHKFPWTIAVEMRPELERAKELMMSSSVSFKYLLVAPNFSLVLFWYNRRGSYLVHMR
jgi:hypothetical protein